MSMTSTVEKLPILSGVLSRRKRGGVALNAISRLPELSRDASRRGKDPSEVNDSAEHILGELGAKHDTSPRRETTRQQVWAAAEAWSETRTPHTYGLALYVIEHFPGESKATYLRALELAKDTGISFTEAIDEAAASIQ